MAVDHTDDRPAYDRGPQEMLIRRGPRAGAFATQILDTVAPFLDKVVSQWDVLDVGCGYGHTSLELARRCAHVVGIEPSDALYRHARQLQDASGVENLHFEHQSVYNFSQHEAFDLVVLDNVLEHLADQPRALEVICAAMRPSGIVYLLVPNKLWPMEVHYGLPFLSYLPLRLANSYLRCTGRGADYTDASYAPTYCSLNRMLHAQEDLSFQYVLPAHMELASYGRWLHYRIGAMLIRRWPWLWAISKVFLVIARKHSRPAGDAR